MSISVLDRPTIDVVSNTPSERGYVESSAVKLFSSDPSTSVIGVPTEKLALRAGDISAKGVGLEMIGYAPLFLRPIVLPQARSVVMPLALDPHYQQGALGMPLEVRRKVRTQIRSGVSFDSLYILHELSDASMEVILEQPDIIEIDLDRIVGPPKLDPLAERAVGATVIAARCGGIAIAVGVAVPAVLIAAAAVAVTAAVAAVPVVAVGAALAAAGPGPGLDPVLIGVVTEDGDTRVGQQGAFFSVASWR